MAAWPLIALRTRERPELSALARRVTAGLFLPAQELYRPAAVAEKLPGPGTVFLNVNWNFKAPVRPGDTITGAVEVTKVRTDKPITELTTTVTRDDGTVALEGTALCYTMPLTGSA